MNNNIVQAAPQRGFVYALFCDENGIPDEANVAFIVSLVVLAIGAFRPGFPLTTFAAAVCAIIPIYRLSRGDLRAPAAVIVPVEKPPTP